MLHDGVHGRNHVWGLEVILFPLGGIVFVELREAECEEQSSLIPCYLFLPRR